MKIRNRAKRLLYFSFGLLFFTGLAYEITERWLGLKDAFGVGQSLGSVWELRAHSLLGLCFMIVFGYIYAKHVEPSLRQKRQRKSGLLLVGVFVVLFMTVPLLFYLGDESARAWVASFHTYLGLALIAPFLAHAFWLKSRAR